MFQNCESLANINLSNFNDQYAANMESCSIIASLTNINLSNLNTQNVTNMKSIFEDCHYLINNYI